MSSSLWAAMALVAVSAMGLAWTPGRLAALVSGRRPPAAVVAGQTAALAMVGALVLLLKGNGALAPAVAIMALGAVCYYDLRFLVIPDIHVLCLGFAAVAVHFARHLGWTELIVGAVAAGGLLAGVAWLWRRMAGVDGLGQGDVKLAAGLGALFGAEQGLLVVAVAAWVGIAWGLAAQTISSDRTRRPIPYGAALGLVAIGVLACRW